VWGVQFLRECTGARAHRNALVKLRLCRYSERLLHRWAQEEKIDYGARRRGALYLYRSEPELRAGWARSAVLRASGRKQLLLDPGDVRQREPALAEAGADGIAGAIFDPFDSSGDSERFTGELARRCEAMGVQFHFNRRVTELRAVGRRVTSAVLSDGSIEGDAYVLALGAGSAWPARTIGQRLAIYPVRGYTATFPLRAGALAPELCGVDEASLVGWSRQDAALRMSTSAEFAGYSTSWTAADVEPIVAAARRLFPDAADYGAGAFRAGLRPMTPDGAPRIGRGAHDNLIYNTGHGHMGWTMACGSAQITSDVLDGRQPAIELDGLRPR
jgi:D-amino-acid dehydrogenase